MIKENALGSFLGGWLTSRTLAPAPEDVVLVMLSFALDAGGDARTPVLTVAGFGSSEKDWDVFSDLWSKRLDREGIAFFRAVDASHFRGQFEPFHDRPDRKEWREQLFADLMEILQSNVYRKFGCSIFNPELNKMNAAIAEEFSLEAYSLAGRTTEKHIREWVAEEWSRSTLVAIIFETGDKGKGKLQKRMTEDGCFPPNFRPKKDTVKEDGTIEKGYVPLQAGDWLAYEHSIAVKQVESGEVTEPSQLRWPMQQFLSIPGNVSAYTAENLKEMEKNINLVQRINEWEKLSGLDQLRAKRQKHQT
jgi:hypothetical protein